jgi:hypothetical protein
VTVSDGVQCLTHFSMSPEKSNMAASDRNYKVDKKHSCLLNFLFPSQEVKISWGQKKILISKKFFFASTLTVLSPCGHTAHPTLATSPWYCLSACACWSWSVETEYCVDRRAPRMNDRTYKTDRQTGNKRIGTLIVAIKGQPAPKTWRATITRYTQRTQWEISHKSCSCSIS